MPTDMTIPTHIASVNGMTIPRDMVVSDRQLYVTDSYYRYCYLASVSWRSLVHKLAVNNYQMTEQFLLSQDLSMAKSLET